MYGFHFLVQTGHRVGVHRTSPYSSPCAERQQAAVGLDAIVVRLRLTVAHDGDLRVGEPCQFNHQRAALGSERSAPRSMMARILTSPARFCKAEAGSVD